MHIVGITGGIGSGKTTVAKMFETYGIAVYYSDDEAKALMNTNKTIKTALIKVFGAEVYLDNKLNRPYLANLVFNDKAKLAKLNAIVHPEVRNHFLTWVEKQNTPFVLKENAILYESGDNINCNEVLVVTAPLATKIARVIKRDNTARETVLARINNQWDDKKKIELADYVIDNTELTKTIQEVKRIYQKIILKIK
jgi:dephospho-CoA kinase